MGASSVRQVVHTLGGMAPSNSHEAPAPAAGPLDRGSAEDLARTLRTVADPTRLQLLSLLRASAAGEAAVGDLAEALGLTQPTVSHHLRLLHEDGLLSRQQRGRQVWYAIAAERRAAVADLLR